MNIPSLADLIRSHKTSSLKLTLPSVTPKFFTPKPPTSEELAGVWQGRIGKVKALFFISPDIYSENKFSGTIFYSGFKENFNGKIKDNGEIVLQGTDYQDLFKKLKEEIESAIYKKEKFYLDTFNLKAVKSNGSFDKLTGKNGYKTEIEFFKTSFSSAQIFASLSPSCITTYDYFPVIKVTYSLNSAQVWRGIEEFLQRKKENLLLMRTSRNKKLIITELKKESGLLRSTSIHKYIIIVEGEKNKTTVETKMMEYLYNVKAEQPKEILGFSLIPQWKGYWYPVKSPQNNTDSSFFRILEKILRRQTNKKDLVVARSYYAPRDSSFSKQFKGFLKEFEKFMSDMVEVEIR